MVKANWIKFQELWILCDDEGQKKQMFRSNALKYMLHDSKAYLKNCSQTRVYIKCPVLYVGLSLHIFTFFFFVGWAQSCSSSPQPPWLKDVIERLLISPPGEPERPLRTPRPWIWVKRRGFFRQTGINNVHSDDDNQRANQVGKTEGGCGGGNGKDWCNEWREISLVQSPDVEETEGLDGSSLVLPLWTKTTALQLIKSTTQGLSN